MPIVTGNGHWAVMTHRLLLLKQTGGFARTPVDTARSCDGNFLTVKGCSAQWNRTEQHHTLVNRYVINRVKSISLYTVHSDTKIMAWNEVNIHCFNSLIVFILLTTTTQSSYFNSAIILVLILYNLNSAKLRQKCAAVMHRNSKI